MSNLFNMFNDGVYDVDSNFKKSSPTTITLSQTDDIADTTTYLYHTNELAHGAIEVVTTNAVRTGLKLQSNVSRSILGINEEEAEAKQEEIEELFKLYSESTAFDIQGEKNFKQLQEVAYRTMKLTGGAIILFPEDKKDDVFGQKIKILEAHHLSNKDNKKDTHNLSGGVKRSKSGRVTHYQLLKGHPNNVSIGKREKWVEVPVFSGIKRNIVHYYEQKRAGQTRGIPYLAPVVDIFRKITDYSEAELDAAILNARFAGFIWNDTPPQYQDEDDETTQKKPLQIKKGNLIQLEQGWKVDFADPSRPNANYVSFRDAQIQNLCVALQIPFEQFMKLYRASYSASRGANLEGKKYTNSQQADLASHFCQPAFENFLLYMVRKGHIVLDGFLTSPLKRLAWLGSEWIADGTEPLNPVHEANADKTNIALGLTTKDREAKKLNGSSFKRNIKIAKKEAALTEDSGLPYIGTNLPKQEKK